MNWIDIFQSLGIFFLALAFIFNTKQINLLRDKFWNSTFQNPQSRRSQNK